MNVPMWVLIVLPVAGAIVGVLLMGALALAGRHSEIERLDNIVSNARAMVRSELLPLYGLRDDEKLAEDARAAVDWQIPPLERVERTLWEDAP